MKIKMLLVLVLVALALSGCETTPSGTQKSKASSVVKSEKNSTRYQITRIAVIEDDLAYRNQRGIYVIKDTETDTEYFGISGIGITENGSHSNGKINIADEK
jgi:hypothetical protein